MKLLERAGSHRAPARGFFTSQVSFPASRYRIFSHLGYPFQSGWKLSDYWNATGQTLRRGEVRLHCEAGFADQTQILARQQTRR